MNIKNTIPLMTALIFPWITNAQVKSHNNNIWFHEVLTLKFHPKWSFTLESTMRYTEWLNKKQQWFIRPSADYHAGGNLIFSLGYSRYTTYPYGEPAMFYRSVPEDHIWLQVAHKVKKGRAQISNRLRDENRWVGIPFRFTDSLSGHTYDGIERFEYRNRIRWMFLSQTELLNRKGKPFLSLIAGNEVFLNAGSFSGKSLLNQNRVIAGIGLQDNAGNQLQVTYIQQSIRNFNNTIAESNPTIRISFVRTFKLHQP